MATQNTEVIQERNAKWLWGGIIVGFLVLQIAMSLGAAYVATSNPPSYTVEDFHEVGLNWDQHKAKKHKSDQLKWNLVSSLEDQIATGETPVPIQFVLRDADEKPVTGGIGKVTLFHHAHASQKQILDLQESPAGSGIYIAQASLFSAGIWQANLVIEVGENTFLQEMTYELQ